MFKWKNILVYIFGEVKNTDNIDDSFFFKVIKIPSVQLNSLKIRISNFTFPSQTFTTWFQLLEATWR